MTGGESERRLSEKERGYQGQSVRDQGERRKGVQGKIGERRCRQKESRLGFPLPLQGLSGIGQGTYPTPLPPVFTKFGPAGGGSFGGY